MNTRKTFAGGEIEISSDELNLMPVANREGLSGIANGIGEAADFIVSGVNAIINAGVDVSVSDGFVFLDGEMLKVDAGIVPRTVGTDLYQFQKFTTFPDPNGERNFRDATTHNVYEHNRAVPVNVAAITGLSVVGSNMTDILKTIIQVQSDWNQGDSGQPDFIKNKPNIVNTLVQGRFNIGQIGVASVGTLYPVSGGLTSAQKTLDGVSEEIISVVFPSVGTTLYHPIITIISAGSNHLNDNDVSFVVYQRTTTSFQFSIAGKDQNEFADVLITIIPSVV